MADVTYKIVIETASGGEGKKSNFVAPTTHGESVTAERQEAGQGVYTTLRNLSNLAPIAYAKKAADKLITYKISRVGIETGNQRAQEQLEFAYSSARTTLAIGAQIAVGAVTANPALLVSGAVSAVDAGINLLTAQKTLDTQRTIENQSIYMSNVRAGGGRKQ